MIQVKMYKIIIILGSTFFSVTFLTGKTGPIAMDQ